MTIFNKSYTQRAFICTIIFLCGLCIVALFVYSFNLKEFSWFEDDSARDTLRSLQILRNREITAIGPPLSFGQYGMREIYFGSLVYYLGAFGLWIFNENVLGPVYILLSMYVLSIPFFFKLTGFFTKNKLHRSLITVSYALGPISVIHSRFFWNPNFIIPFAVIFWICIFQSIRLTTQNKIKYLFAGCAGFIAALMINLHYSVLVSILFVILYLIIKREYRIIVAFLVGLFMGLSPLIIFEIRNKFYLSQAIIYNLLHPVHELSDRPLMFRLLDIGIVIPIMLGLHQDFPFDMSLFQISLIVKSMIGLSLWGIVIYVSKRKWNQNNMLMFVVIIASIISSLIFSKEIFAFRYMFAIFPVFLIIFIEYVLTFFETTKWHSLFLTSVIFVIMLSSSVKVITAPTIVTYKKFRMPSIIDLEKISDIIIQDSPQPLFNITENITGDSRMLYLRYFVFRDMKDRGLGDPTEYMGLKTLYVLTPSLKKTIKENRWEFRATPNLHLIKEWSLKEYKLLRFDAI